MFILYSDVDITIKIKKKWQKQMQIFDYPKVYILIYTNLFFRPELNFHWFAPIWQPWSEAAIYKYSRFYYTPIVHSPNYSMPHANFYDSPVFLNRR